MSKFTIISSRDTFVFRDAAHTFEIAADLRKEGHDVTLFLVQNGVLGARKSSASVALHKLAETGVEILADDFSLRERGIPESRLTDGVRAAALDRIVDDLGSGHRVIWH